MSDSQHDINRHMAMMGVPQPLMRHGAFANLADATSPNPFVAAPCTPGAVCGQKRTLNYGFNGSPPALQPAMKRRPMFVTPLAMLAAPPNNVSLTPWSGHAGLLPASAYTHSTDTTNTPGQIALPTIPTFPSHMEGEDGDVEGSEYSTMPSSPTMRYSKIERPGASSTSTNALRRKSTDASLIEKFEGAFAVVQEDEEPSNNEGGSARAQEEEEEEADTTSGADGEDKVVDGNCIPATYTVKTTKGWVTPDVPTPAISRRAVGFASSSTAWTFYNGYAVGGPVSPYGTTNPHVFATERLSTYVYARAMIEKFMPGVPSRRRPLMTLLHLLSYVTGAEGVSIEEYGAMLAECGICDRFIFIDHKDLHICPPASDQLTRGLREGGRLRPHAVIRWMIEMRGSLSKKDLDSIFGLCTGCHFIVLGCVGREHSEHCSASKATRRA